ncbi:MAG TPA: ATP-binding protein [Kofleriaceae bacterium]
MSLSIRYKLLFLSVVPTVLAVVVVGMVLVHRQAERLDERLAGKTARYSEVASVQLRSAVAFGDTATAEEIIVGIAHDPEVTGAQLYGANHELIYEYGATIPVDDPAAVPRVMDDELVDTAAVDSLEGPHGTFVIGVSRAALHQEQRLSYKIMAGVAIAAALLGFIVVYPTARRTSRRIRDVARYASRVANGDLEAAPPAADGGDEVGRTAAAVGNLVADLRHLMAQDAARAETERERLELMVAQRTAQLEASHRARQLVLDHVQEGLFTVGYDGVLVGECSKATVTMLDQYVAGQTFASMISKHDPRASAGLEVGFSQLANDVLPLELAIDQLPKQMTVRGAVLAMNYAAIGDRQLLVTVVDQTAEIEHAATREMEEEMTALFRQLTADRHGARRFVEDARSQIEVIGSSERYPDVLAALHTLKGNASVIGLNAWVTRCHDAETLIAEQGVLTKDARQGLVWCWSATEASLAPMLEVNGVEISTRDFAALHELARGEARWDMLRALIRDVVLEPTALPLGRLAAHCRELASRQEKHLANVVVDDQGIRLDPERYGALWSALTHVARNAVSHGMRADAATSLWLRTSRVDGDVVIEVADDGPGIQWEALRQRARSAGLPCESRDDLIQAMFTSQISTRDSVDETAGRGVGLAAVAALCAELGVTIEVTTPPRGTSFRFRVPADVKREEVGDACTIAS